MQDKTILPHLDDVGVSAGSVIAWQALRQAGVVRSASVMVPCPYYPFAVEDYHKDPAQDLGIHLTLTSEWSRYRWRPLIGPQAGLVDHEGFFHRRPEDVVANADPGAVEDEICTQIERALADGIRPTHLDAHMGTAFLPPFIERLWNVAARYGLPLPLFRNPSALFRIVGLPAADDSYLRELAREAERRGDPVFDDFLIGFTPEGQPAAAFVSAMVNAAPSGLHWLALHANAPDDTHVLAPHMVWPRQEEYRLFARPDSVSVFNGCNLVNWLDLTAQEASTTYPQ